MANLTREERERRDQENAARIHEAEERGRAAAIAEMEERQRDAVLAAETKIRSTAAPDPRTIAMRPDVRRAAPRHPSVRDADTVAAELRGNRVTADEGHDKFFVAPEDIPDGWTYMWRRATIAGKEDVQYQNGLQRRGWTAVPQERHPDIEVRQDGLILMELPTSIVTEQQERDKRTARLQVAAKEAQLVGETPEGHLPRTAIRGQKVVSKSFESYQPIPE